MTDDAKAATCAQPCCNRVIGYQCYICNRRFAKNGETPTVWEETICGWITGEECPMEASFCVPIGQSRKRTTA